MSRYLNYVLDAVRRPREQLTRGQHNLRYAWELVVHCGRQLNLHRAEGMAAELTYRTIFSLIPVVVLGLVVFRVFGGLEDVQSKVENQLFSFFGVPEIPETYLESDQVESSSANVNPSPSGVAQETTDPTNQRFTVSRENQTAASEVKESTLRSVAADVPEASSDSEPSATASLSSEDESDGNAESANEIAAAVSDVTDPDLAASIQTRASIRRTLHDITTKIASVDFASIGMFGLLLFVYAAIALADSTEYLFNRIYDAPSKRPVHLRVAIHWSIITLGSGLLAMSLYMSNQVIDWFGTIDWIGGGNSSSLAMTTLNHLLSFVASWVLLFLLYALMPNAHVSVRAAGIGAAVSAFLWEAAKYGFQIYVAKAVPYSALYGALGLIPLFLFWIYVTWLIVLFGLILTYTLQTLKGRRLRPDDGQREELPQGDPDWMLPIMAEVASAFEEGGSIGRQDLADRLGLPNRVVRDLEVKLISEGMLRKVVSTVSEDESLTLAKPSEKISVGQILALAHQSRPTNEHPAWKMLANLKLAEREAAGQTTLAELLPFSLKSKMC